MIVTLGGGAIRDEVDWAVLFRGEGPGDLQYLSGCDALECRELEGKKYYEWPKAYSSVIEAVEVEVPFGKFVKGIVGDKVAFSLTRGLWHLRAPVEINPLQHFRFVSDVENAKLSVIGRLRRPIS